MEKQNLRNVVIVMAVFMLISVITASRALAYEMSVKKNPTNESSIEFGPTSMPSWTAKWRAYVKCDSGGQGSNGWLGPAEGNWYYKDNISPAVTRVSWNLSGLQNQSCVVAYWLFYSNGTWEFGPQVIVVSDAINPTATINQPGNGATIDSLNVSVSVSASDERSGLEFVRLYFVTPLSAIAGYSRDSSGNYYKDFSQGFSENIILPQAGTYTITLWVKDRAGNLVMAPSGRTSFTARDTPAQYCGDKICNNGETCTSCLSDCGACVPVQYCGDKICNNGETCSSCSGDCGVCPLPDPQCGDYLCNGSETCETCSLDCGVCETKKCDEANGKYACSFRPLVGAEKETIYSLENSSLFSDGTYWNNQPLYALYYYDNKVHFGADLNRKGGDKDYPIYAPANCLIINYDDISESDDWGKWLILRCQASSGFPFYTEIGGFVDSIDVFIAHLGEIKIHTDSSIITANQIVKKETRVKKGWQIATIGNANGYYGSAYHLHAEYRLFNSTTAGSAYLDWDAVNDVVGTYADPIEFTLNNQQITDERPWIITVPVCATDQTKKVYFETNSGTWETNGRSDENGYSSVGKYDFYQASSSTDAAATWHFKLPFSGKYKIRIILPRDVGTANVKYAITSETAPKLWQSEIINQTSTGSNRRIVLAEFDFIAGTEYTVKVYRSDTEEKIIAVDALELVFQPDGIGGGNDDLLNDPYTLSWMAGWEWQFPFDVLPNPELVVANDSERGSVLQISGSEQQEHWHEQLFSSISVITNELHQFSGSVRGEGTGKIQLEVVAQEQMQSWQEIEVTKLWQDFQMQYWPALSDPEAKIYLHFGEYSGTLYLDNLFDQVITDEAGDDEDIVDPTEPPAEVTDTVAVCSACALTAECVTAFGNGWGCVDNCCQNTITDAQPPEVIVKGLNCSMLSKVPATTALANFLIILLPFLAIIFRKKFVK